jgi:nucleoside-diphosphate-sugar epimerase
MQTILGSGGAIGVLLAKELKSYTNEIRLVSRNPKKVNATDRLFPANLLDRDEVNKAIKGSRVVYVTIGFPYSVKVWKKFWPKFMKYVINACIENNAKLVFFDNIYMYDKDYLNGMTEETPINPPSEKGIIRHKVAQMLLDKIKEGKLNALIARSADFYGPNIDGTSVLTENLFKPYSKGKKGYWLASDTHKHSFTYTPDAAKATALLGNTADAYNQVWHLPTAAHPLTGKEWATTIANEMGVKPKYQVISKGFLSVMGVFIPIMREVKEMLFQNDRDYVFNSEKFNKRFDFITTSYQEGIKEIVQSDYKINV